MQEIKLIQTTPRELQSLIIDAVKAVLSAHPPLEPQPQPQSKYLTARELATYLKRPIGSIYQMQHKGVINGVKMAGSSRLYYDIDVIDAILKGNKAANDITINQ